MRRSGTSALAGLALAVSATAAAALETSVLVFGGLVTTNTWEEVIQIVPIDLHGSGLLGIAGGVHWTLPVPQLELASELQLVRYVGSQTNWEINAVPAMIRWSPEAAPGRLESLAFGLGLSYASAPPTVEVARGGEASREKWYWLIEAAFDAGRTDRDYVLRLHHRSTGNLSIGRGGSTNALVIGLRQSF